LSGSNEILNGIVIAGLHYDIQFHPRSPAYAANLSTAGYNPNAAKYSCLRVNQLAERSGVVRSNKLLVSLLIVVVVLLGLVLWRIGVTPKNKSDERNMLANPEASHASRAQHSDKSMAALDSREQADKGDKTPVSANVEPSKVVVPRKETPVALNTIQESPQFTSTVNAGNSKSDSSVRPKESASNLVYLNELSRINGLGDSLSPEEIKELYEYLEKPVDSNASLDATEINAIKNQIMDKLLEQRVLPGDLGMKLTELFNNKRNDELLRNYSLQHFEPLLQQKVSRGIFMSDASDVIEVRSAFVSPLDEKNNSIAGTALLGMERATALDLKIDRDLVARKAVQYAGDSGCDVRTRIAAVQVCGVMKREDALNVVRELAIKSDPVSLQVAAICTLGHIGGNSDIDGLREISGQGGRFVRNAAEQAIVKIEEKKTHPME
jgi:hypothetical protein